VFGGSDSAPAGRAGDQAAGGGSFATTVARPPAPTAARPPSDGDGGPAVFTVVRRQAFEAHLVLDDASLRNLEVFRTIRDGQRKGSLLWAVDATRTAMGARLLRAWLGAPLRALGAIRERHDAVEVLLAEPRVRGDLQDRLRDVRDIARLAARARLGTVSPRELAALRQSLGALPAVAGLLRELGRRRAPLLTEGQVPGDMSSGAGPKGHVPCGSLPVLLDLGEDLLQDLHAALVRLLVDDPPAHIRDGGMIRPGADAELDRQLGLRDGGREALAAIEARERERTGIANLRVQHNRVFGYYIEVLKTHLARVPADYIRKQTTANAERFVTAELAEHETAVLGAVAAALEREQQLFTTLREQVSAAGDRLLAVAEALARLDVLAGLAEIAEDHAYVRPDMVEEPVLDIEEGRHPVVERMLDAGRFVPNSLNLRASTTAPNGAGRLVLLTGPNMGGKSTAMRMAALVAILAHAGAFVPAVRARVGVVDRVFTRVGAADDLGRGESTFMVEMREAAQILSQATARSLVLLDEIGRGTATYDGLALAWAITEFLHDQIGCRALFATHYHELTQLQARLVGLRNAHVTVHEERGAIVFLHRVETGPAERSYGIQVGRLAGLPASVLRRAQKLLTRLEAAQGEARPLPQLDLFAAPAPPPEVVDTAPPALAAILADLRALHPDELSPRHAHEALRRLHERLVAVEGCP